MTIYGRCNWLWLKLKGCGLLGFRGGREEVVAVAVDGGADGFAPGIRAEGLAIFVLGDVDGLH
jgi:hypothetical protein